VKNAQSKTRTIDLRTVLDDLRVAAELTVASDGGPVRTIINGRHRKPTGRYASRKAGRSLPWEGTDERSYFWLCEADTDVTSYLSQPHRLTIFREDGDAMDFYPDILRKMASGRTEIVEVKKTFGARDRGADPEYALKLELARQVYAGLGWSFQVITRAEMQDGYALRNAKYVQRNRFAKFGGGDRLTLLSAIDAAGGRLTMQGAIASLGAGPRAEAKLKAILVGRVVSIDLRGRLDAYTAVTAVHQRADVSDAAAYPHQ
jgi:hypothetical protein